MKDEAWSEAIVDLLHKAEVIPPTKDKWWIRTQPESWTDSWTKPRKKPGFIAV